MIVFKDIHNAQKVNTIVLSNASPKMLFGTLGLGYPHGQA